MTCIPAVLFRPPPPHPPLFIRILISCSLNAAERQCSGTKKKGDIFGNTTMVKDRMVLSANIPEHLSGFRRYCSVWFCYTLCCCCFCRTDVVIPASKEGSGQVSKSLTNLGCVSHAGGLSCLTALCWCVSLINSGPVQFDSSWTMMCTCISKYKFSWTDEQVSNSSPETCRLVSVWTHMDRIIRSSAGLHRTYLLMRRLFNYLIEVCWTRRRSKGCRTLTLED